jgi:hypothetical protein
MPEVSPTRVLVTIGRPAEAPRARHAMSSDRLCLRGLGLDAAFPFSPLPKPWSAATPRPTLGSRCRSPQPGAKCPAPSRGRASPQPMAGPCPSLCSPACPTTLCSRPRPSPQRALKLGAAHALSRPSPSRSLLCWQARPVAPSPRRWSADPLPCPCDLPLQAPASPHLLKIGGRNPWPVLHSCVREMWVEVEATPDPTSP